MRCRCVLVLLPALLGLPACETADCTPTLTVAAPGSKLDLAAPESSAVLRATLATEAAPLPDRELRFDLLAEGATVHTVRGTSAADGTAVVDLKRLDPQTLSALARADAFRASFPGDSTYCASGSTADVEVLRGPDGAPVVG